MAKRNNLTAEQIINDVRSGAKKFVGYKEGAELYSMGLHTFQEMAREAGAVYKIRKIALVNTEIFDDFLENFREPPSY